MKRISYGIPINGWHPRLKDSANRRTGEEFLGHFIDQRRHGVTPPFSTKQDPLPGGGGGLSLFLSLSLYPFPHK
jgi:hypothetical protein